MATDATSAGMLGAGDLAQANARLREEVALLTRALSAFEPLANATAALDDENEARRLFEMFDTNNDGLLEEPELRRMAAHLGEVVEVTTTGWPVDEMWTFDHFYEWWSSPQERQPHPALTAADHATLAALRAKLRSEPYMRTVHRLAERTVLAPPSPQVVGSPDKGKTKDDDEGSPKGEGDNLCKINVKVGPFEEPACGATISYAFSPDDARQYRKQYLAKDQGALLSLYFTINEGIDDFELGELAGSLRNILLVTKHEFDCIDFKTQVVNEDGTRTFKLTLVFDHNSYMEIITGTLTSFQIQRLEGQVELSEAPLDEESIEFMRARASLSAIVDRSAVDFVRAFMSKGEEPRRGQFADLIDLFSTFRDVDLNLRFDDLGDLFHQAYVDAPVADVRGWQSANALATGLLRSLLVQKEEAADIFLMSLYPNMKKFLRGIDAVRFQIGANIFTLKGSNLDVIALMPAAAELGLGSASA